MKSVAFGKGLEGGETGRVAPFTVEVRTSAGELVGRGESPVSVVVTDSNGDEVPVTLTDRGDGTFAGEYLPKEPGDHTVTVTLGEKRPPHESPIGESPFTVPIAPGTDGAQSDASGPGLKSGIPDNKPTHFTIQARFVTNFFADSKEIAMERKSAREEIPLRFKSKVQMVPLTPKSLTMTTARKKIQ